MIPELCVMTGLSEQQRQDFHLMKELDAKIQPEPFTRIQSCRDLIGEFKTNKFTKSILDEWQLIIDESPLAS